jgi:hypothetical protein
VSAVPVAAPAPAEGTRTRPANRRLLAGLLVLAAIGAVAALVAVDPFGSSTPSSAGTIDNGYPTSLTRIERRSLTSQTQVSATLGYGDASTISVPGGTAPSSVTQAQQAVTTAASQLSSAQTAQSADEITLGQARATLAAAAAKQAVDCSGAGAAQAGAPTGGSGGGGGSAGACATDVQAVATDRMSVTQDQAKVASDANQISTAETSLSNARANLTTAEASAAAYGQGSTFTMLPQAGQVIRRGQTLYGINGTRAILLYGSATPWRAFMAGMAPGPDVAALNANLEALGYGSGLGGDSFTAGTAAAIAKLQAARGLAQTGSLALGSVIFQPGAVRVTSVTPTLGSPVQAGAVLGITSTRRVVTIALDAAQQSNVRVGEPVLITLPDNSTTPGRVSYVGTVATAPSSSDQGGGSSSPTIEVDVIPTHPAATGRLDQAPVNVSIVTGSVQNALVVPVNALLALGNGGYAVEVASGSGRHLVGVQLGLFDDADGLVQVMGSGLAAGQRVVIPAQ